HPEPLRFSLNHGGGPRSEHARRVGGGPAGLLSGRAPAHGLELLGYERFSQAQAARAARPGDAPASLRRRAGSACAPSRLPPDCYPKMASSEPCPLFPSLEGAGRRKAKPDKAAKESPHSKRAKTTAPPFSASPVLPVRPSPPGSGGEG